MHKRNTSRNLPLNGRPEPQFLQMRCQMRPLYTAASVHALFSVCVAAQGAVQGVLDSILIAQTNSPFRAGFAGQIAFIEREFYNMSDFVAVNRWVSNGFCADAAMFVPRLLLQNNCCSGCARWIAVSRPLSHCLE